MSSLTDLLVASDLLATTAVAFMALYYARCQVRIHRSRVKSEQRDRCLQRKYDLFDRRWEIYIGVRDFLTAMSSSSHESLAAVEVDKMLASRPSPPRMNKTVLILQEAQQDLWSLMPKAHFLFDRDVNQYLEELNTHCLALLAMERKLATTPSGRYPDAWMEETAWFEKQYTIAKQKFENYLRL